MLLILQVSVCACVCVCVCLTACVLSQGPPMTDEFAGGGGIYCVL